jgi:guanylate kinase
MSSIQCEPKANKRQTREISDIKDIIDIDFACTRSRFSEAVFIHLYCRKIRQQKEKTTTKRIDKLKKIEDKILNASADVNTIMNTSKTINELAESKTSCNIFIPLDLIFERS